MDLFWELGGPLGGVVRASARTFPGDVIASHGSHARARACLAPRVPARALFTITGFR